MTAKRFTLFEDLDIKDKSTGKIYPPCLDKGLSELVDLLNQLNDENEQLKKELEYIQNSITEHIKHQKTELGQKALKEIIADYNEWMLGHKGVDE